jgi:arylsulfatase A-like enzyme
MGRGLQRAGRLPVSSLAAACAVAALLIAWVLVAPGHAAAARPNVVVIETDDQTVESMKVMRNVRRLLAARGVTFTNSFATTPLCCPSRATLLTGQYSHNHRVLQNRGGFDMLNHGNTLAVWLSRAGYRTAMVGKYLNGYELHPTAVPPGWREWFALTEGAYYGYVVNHNRRRIVRAARTPANYSTDFLARHAVSVIRNTRRPLFLWYTPFAPHAGGKGYVDSQGGEVGDRGGSQGGELTGSPTPPPRYVNRFRTTPLPRPPSFNEADVTDKPGKVRKAPPLSPATITAVTRRYRATLASLLAVDDAVAAIVRALQQTGKLGNTLIIFTSDNGFLFGEHRVGGKTYFYEPSIRVPLILRGPGIPRGIRRELVTNADLAPTIVKATGVTPGRVMDGRPLFPAANRPAVFLEALNNRNSVTGLRTTQFTYIEWKDGFRELYDLRTDRHQLTNRAMTSAYAAVRDQLAQRLAQVRSCAGAACP